MSTKLVNLKDGSDYLVPRVFGGINTSNVIATKTSVTSYTATQDCIVKIKSRNSVVINFSIGGVVITATPAVSNMYTLVPLKKGQVLSMDNSTDCVAYGIKY